MYHVDLHAHTRFFHAMRARPTPYDPLGARLLGRVAAARGMDGVAVTNHDYHRPFDHDEVTLIPGIEISTTLGHVLVIGPDPPVRTEPGALTPQEAVDLAHERGCATVLPHPYRNSTVRESTAEFDAVELNGKHPDTHDRARALADDRQLSLTAGSDAHFPFEAARGFTRIDAEALTPEAVVDAIRGGRIDPVHRGAISDRVLAPAYRAIHRVKGQRA